MGTTQRITTLCDGDKRLIYQELEKDNSLSVWALQIEYFIYQYHGWAEEVAIALKELFTPAWEEVTNAFKALGERFEKIIESKVNRTDLQKDWHRYWQITSNNYRKLHSLHLLRRPRCRWRSRESHRQLDGLSPGIVITEGVSALETEQ